MKMSRLELHTNLNVEKQPDMKECKARDSTYMVNKADKTKS